MWDVNYPSDLDSSISRNVNAASPLASAAQSPNQTTVLSQGKRNGQLKYITLAETLHIKQGRV